MLIKIKMLPFFPYSSSQTFFNSMTLRLKNPIGRLLVAAQPIIGCDQMGLVRSDCAAHKGQERCQRKIFIPSYYCYITKEFKMYWLRTMTYEFPHDSVGYLVWPGLSRRFSAGLTWVLFCFVFTWGFHVSVFTWELPSCSLILCIHPLRLPEQDTRQSGLNTEIYFLTVLEKGKSKKFLAALISCEGSIYGL